MTELEPNDVHLGQWVPVKALWRLLPSMSQSYHNRLKRFFVGDADDLAQSAALALLQWSADNGQPERIRELVGLAIIHKAMVEEVRNNRHQSADDDADPLLLTITDERRQLTDSQIKLLERIRNQAARIAKRPNWECLWLAKSFGWSEMQIQSYFRSKKDDRHFYSVEQIRKSIALAERRIRMKLNDFLKEETQLLEWWRSYDVRWEEDLR